MPFSKSRRGRSKKYNRPSRKQSRKSKPRKSRRRRRKKQKLKNIGALETIVPLRPAYITLKRLLDKSQQKLNEGNTAEAATNFLAAVIAASALNPLPQHPCAVRQPMIRPEDDITSGLGAGAQVQLDWGFPYGGPPPARKTRKQRRKKNSN